MHTYKTQKVLKAYVILTLFAPCISESCIKIKFKEIFFSLSGIGVGRVNTIFEQFKKTNRVTVLPPPPALPIQNRVRISISFEGF